MSVSEKSGNHWVKCISTQGGVRGVALEATGLIQEMALRHQLKGESIKGLAEAVMGAILLASYTPLEERVNLNIQGSGFFQQALIDAHPDGRVRGYLIERAGKIALEEKIGPWGSGFLSVLRTRDQEWSASKPSVCTVPLLTGHLAKDLSFYWVQGEQIPSAVGLTVYRQEEKIISANGFLVQALPGADALEVSVLEQHIHEMQAMAVSATSGFSPLQLLSHVFQSTAFMVLEERPISFFCDCSWERVQRTLLFVGVNELHSMLIQEGSVIVRCDFCSKEYLVEAFALKELIHVSQTTDVFIS